MPPKEELFAPFENQLEFSSEEENCCLEWKYEGGHYFFRPAQSSSDLIWFARFGMASDFFGVANEEKRRFYELALQLTFMRGHYSRLVPAFEATRAPYGSWLLLRPGASGFLLPDGRRRANWNVVFPWVKGQEAFLRAPLSELELEVVRAIANAPDEWHSVLSWAQMSREERFWSIVSWKRGGELEWKHLVRALLHLELHRKPRQADFGWEIFALDNPRFAFGPLRMTKHPFMNQGFAPSVWQLLEVVEKHFGARIDYSRHRGLTGPFCSNPRMMIRSLCPTHHQRMQALDLWRDFGRSIGQLAQVEACLRELLT